MQKHLVLGGRYAKMDDFLINSFVLTKKICSGNLCKFYESSENLTFSRPCVLSQQIEENTAWNVLEHAISRLVNPL